MIKSAALSASVGELFAKATPALAKVAQLGFTDFAATAPEFYIAPNATIKAPLFGSGVAAAFAAGSNDFLSGSEQTGTMTASNLLIGHSITGQTLDGIDGAPRIKQIFAARAGMGLGAGAIALACTALDSASTSSINIPAIGTVTLAQYQGLVNKKDWIQPALSVLVLNGAEMANVKALFAANGVIATPEELAAYLGFAAVVCMPTTARAFIIPEGCFGMLGRVPTLVANYRESGVEVDPETGLAVNIVVADDQASNKIKVSANAWLAAGIKSYSSSAATVPGVIKIGTGV